MNITQIKMPSLLPTGWVALVALLLVVFSAPSLIMRLSTVSQESTRLSLLQGKPVSDAALSTFLTGRERALSLMTDSSFYNDLAMAEIEFSARVATGELVLGHLERAAFWQKHALALAPADPYGWFRLAYIYEMQEGQSMRAVQAWHQSFSAAPYEPPLVLSRLLMALRMEKDLGLQAGNLLRRLILQAWNYNPWDLTRAARDHNFLPLAQEALKDSPEALARMDLILREQL